MIKKPNFFIVGAPKCGTTALNEYLKSHPNIFMVNRKESHYFNTDMPKLRGFTQLIKYLELYQECQPEHLIIGEASVWYLYSSEALHNIYQFNKNAKIIAMVRNPIEMVYSLFMQLKYNLEEDQTTFEAAWKLQNTRQTGKMLPPLYREAKILQYGQIGQLSNQIERLYSIFPPEQVKIIVFDDLKRSPQQVYKEVLSFLGLNDDGQDNFPPVNESKIYNIKWLHRFIYRPPRLLASVLNHWKPLRDITNGVIDQIREWNTLAFHRQPLPTSFRKELAIFFQDDVNKLSELLQRDLMYWINE